MQFYHSNLLSSVTNVTHAFTTKNSGNLAFHVQDDPKTVEQNHEVLAKQLGYKKHALIHMKQMHSSHVHIVNDDDNFSHPRECDALITNKKNTPLMVMVADCSPILFFDSVQAVIGVAHAGRQGAFKNIILKTIDSMSTAFNTLPQDITVSVGASIGVCCYQVGDEIYKEALELGLDYAFERKNNSYYLNISKILYAQFIAAGMKEKNIEISSECTSCLCQKYYSFRAEKETGRFCGVIYL